MNQVFVSNTTVIHDDRKAISAEQAAKILLSGGKIEVSQPDEWDYEDGSCICGQSAVWELSNIICSEQVYTEEQGTAYIVDYLRGYDVYEYAQVEENPSHKPIVGLYAVVKNEETFRENDTVFYYDIVNNEIKRGVLKTLIELDKQVLYIFRPDFDIPVCALNTIFGVSKDIEKAYQLTLDQLEFRKNQFIFLFHYQKDKI